MKKLIMVAVSVLALSACAGKELEIKKVFVDTNATCEILQEPLDSHMNSVIDNGEKMISAGADEVLVTAVDLTDTYKETCRK